jgi:lipoprotein signal peptidase
VKAAAATALTVLILDGVTKYLALQRLPAARPVPVIDGFFSLTLVMNPGLAFGSRGHTAGWRWLVASCRSAPSRCAR